MELLSSKFDGRTIKSIEYNEYGIGFMLDDGNLVCISQKIKSVTVIAFKGNGAVKSISQQSFKCSDESIELVLIDDLETVNYPNSTKLSDSDIVTTE